MSFPEIICLAMLPLAFGFGFCIGICFGFKACKDHYKILDEPAAWESNPPEAKRVGDS
jgi:hypothetical protein